VPRASLSIARLDRLLGRRTTRSELTELLFPSKAQVEGGEGDVLDVEGTADRLDLLTEGGLALHLAGVLGSAEGPPALTPPRGPPFSLVVDPSVVPLRPAIAGLVVEPPEGSTLDDDLLAEAIQFQELLHATIGLDRRLASLGMYPMARVRAPVRYSLEPLESVRFVPLDATEPVDGGSFFEGHPMALRYGRFGRVDDRCLTLRDARGEILSLPPILNARSTGEARAGDTGLLLESTGTRASRVGDMLGLLSLVFAARGWRVGPVAVEGGGGAGDGSAVLRPRRLHLRATTLAALGGTDLPPAKVESLLRRGRLAARRDRDGWSVEAPPWRPDLHAEVDVAEDVLLADGVRAEDGVLLPSPTRGRVSPEARFRTRASELLLGLGFVPLYTTILVPERIVGLAGRTEALAVTNPVSDQFARLRDAILPSLLGTLEHNVRHGYPQRFSEVGPVVRPAPGSETGAETRHHAGAFIASDRAGFADAAALVDYLSRSFGAQGVREPAPLPGTIPGRAAIVRLAGEPIAELGEIAPAILHELRVPMPVAWAEIDLTALLALVRRPA